MTEISIYTLGWLDWLLIIVAGVFTGIINTLAGSGSLITLPIFMFLCGLPAPIANGTNRVGVFFQTLVGLIAYRRSGSLKLEGSAWLILPTILGAVIGAWFATRLDRTQMFNFIGALMIVMLIVVLIKPKRWLRESSISTQRNKHPLMLGIMLIIGFYGGFIQAGVGIFLLAALVLGAHYSLTAANGIKLMAVMVFNLPALAIFLWHDQVNWTWGLIMAACQSVGSVIGVRFVSKVPNANVWIRRLLILTILASSVKLLGIWDWIMGLTGA